MALAMGLHPRVGIEDTIIDQHGKRFTSVQQIQQTVRIAHELGREIASGKEAREIYKIGVQYKDVEETLRMNGMAPNRVAGQKHVPLRA
ncbi:3-keto-5-aminohexanoate cleavage enzyme [compost metagenome]